MYMTAISEAVPQYEDGFCVNQKVRVIYLNLIPIYATIIDKRPSIGSDNWEYKCMDKLGGIQWVPESNIEACEWK